MNMKQSFVGKASMLADAKILATVWETLTLTRHPHTARHSRCCSEGYDQKLWMGIFPVVLNA